MGSLNKKASGAQCFIMALGLFWDIVTGLPWTPNGVSSVEPRGYCIFLPGAHYLTINSPYGADSSLNKLLLLLLICGQWCIMFGPSCVDTSIKCGVLTVFNIELLYWYWHTFFTNSNDPIYVYLTTEYCHVQLSIVWYHPWWLDLF